MLFVPLSDPHAPNVVVTRLTLVCETAPEPLTLDLTGGSHRASFRLTVHPPETHLLSGDFAIIHSLTHTVRVRCLDQGQFDTRLGGACVVLSPGV